VGITKNELSSILRALAVTLDALNDQQFQNWIQGKGRLVYREEKLPADISSNVPSRELPVTVDPRVENIIARLNKCTSREEASSFLVNSKLTKAVLQDLCRSIQVHALKSDTKDRLVQKIVESLVGARLRSEAIKQTDLKGRSTD
jgi:hypothetical protein